MVVTEPVTEPGYRLAGKTAKSFIIKVGRVRTGVRAPPPEQEVARSRARKRAPGAGPTPEHLPACRVVPAGIRGPFGSSHSCLLHSPERLGTTETRYSAPRSSMRTLKLIRSSSAMSSLFSTLMSWSADRCLTIDSETHSACDRSLVSCSSCQTWNPASGSISHRAAATLQPCFPIQAMTAAFVSGGICGCP
jgi:hypothetical protein